MRACTGTNARQECAGVVAGWCMHRPCIAGNLAGCAYERLRDADSVAQDALEFVPELLAKFLFLLIDLLVHLLLEA